jgi:hypothetical protein
VPLGLYFMFYNAGVTVVSNEPDSDEDHETRQIAATALAIAVGRLRLCEIHNKPYASPLAELTDPHGLLDKFIDAKETRAIFSSRRQVLEYMQETVLAHPVSQTDSLPA